MGKDVLIATIEAAMRKNAAARERKQNKGKPTGLLSMWNDAVIECHGKDYVVAPTSRALGSLNRACKRLPIADDPSKLREFFYYAVSKWTDIKATQFKNYIGYPQYPVIEFFVKSIQKYYFDYCRKPEAEVISEVPKLALLERQLRERDETIKKLRADLDATKRQLALARKKMDRMKSGKTYAE